MDFIDRLKFILELLNLMCDEVQDMEFASNNAENIKRLHITYDSMRKAYVTSSPIVERGI